MRTTLLLALLLAGCAGRPYREHHRSMDCWGQQRFTGEITDASLPSTRGRRYTVFVRCDAGDPAVRYGVRGTGQRAIEGTAIVRRLFAMYRREGMTGVWRIAFGLACRGAGPRVYVADYTQLERIIELTGEWLERARLDIDVGFILSPGACIAR